ncbi:MAG: hypothetical protein HDT28_08690 [Clostridiales bacterium]|nr:hypothetical protein [Clostridiales bacterium]
MNNKLYKILAFAAAGALACSGLIACASDSDPLIPMNELSGKRLVGNNVKWLGRTEYDAETQTVDCSYTATGFEVRFIGTRLDVTFTATNTDSAYNRPYFYVSVDGSGDTQIEDSNENYYKVYPLTESVQTVTVVDGLDENKVHTVMVLKASEPENSRTSVKSILTDGDFIKPKKSSAPKFQILGGSGISGHGCLGKEGESWTTENSSSMYGFGYLAARMFGGECEFVSNSGMGIKWGYRGVASLIDAYEATGLTAEYNADGSTKSVAPTDSKWDHESSSPDVVIINIGGNDWNSHISLLDEGSAERKTAENEFCTAVKTLLDRIHGLHPAADIAWTCNSKTTGNGALAKSVIDELSYRSQIVVIEIDNAKDGADNHAGLETQRKNAETVATEISAAFGLEMK